MQGDQWHEPLTALLHFATFSTFSMSLLISDRLSSLCHFLLLFHPHRSFFNLQTQYTCQHPSSKKVEIPGGENRLVLLAEGKRTFWCNNSKFELNGKGKLHGDTTAKLFSRDGEWEGEHHYSHTTGLPIWTAKNKKTGKEIHIVGEQKPQAREEAPNKQPMTWDRRKVDKSEGVDVDYVIRTKTTSGRLPIACKGDIDAHVPFTAVFTFVKC